MYTDYFVFKWWRIVLGSGVNDDEDNIMILRKDKERFQSHYSCIGSSTSFGAGEIWGPLSSLNMKYFRFINNSIYVWP